MKRWLRRKELRLKNSSFFTLHLPARRVFYPGCSLPAADPDFCLKVYRELQKNDPQLGLWFDCCAMPLRLSRDRTAAVREETTLLNGLLAAGVEEVITACGNCYQQFSEFAEGRIRVRMLYDLLEAERLPDTGSARVIHHPCFARKDPALQRGAARLIGDLGLRVRKVTDREHPLACCLHHNESAVKRRRALRGEELLTYCAHCVVTFQEDIPTRHLLQEVYGSRAVWRSFGKYGRFANYRRFCRLVTKLRS